MSVYISAASAAVLIGGDVLGRSVAGATAFTMVFGTKSLVEDISKSAEKSLKDSAVFSFAESREESLYTVAGKAASVALNTLTLCIGMYAVKTAFSFAAMPIEAFSISGALVVSVVSALIAEVLAPQKEVSFADGLKASNVEKYDYKQ